MIHDGEHIKKYMRDTFDSDKHEVFILLERKADANNRDNLNYNYYCRGQTFDKLQCLAHLVGKCADEMGLTFDETIEVMKNAHLCDRTIIRTRYQKRIDEDWGKLNSND